MRRAAILLGALAAASCGGAGGPAPRPLATNVSAARPLAELPQQDLQQGQCGMALWQRTEPARRIAFVLDEPATIRIVDDGKVIVLARTASEGDPVVRHAPVQRFAGAGHSVTIDVRMEQREGLTAGAIIPEGTLTSQSARGSVVLPVFGLIGCR
ncbi:hypothetical protein [Sphingosinicella microcystinivorans]|uniref:NlpE-like protein n=1 Tax=Sphingosinicella microcystinivorans TaxID=335406 RepID=A0AAD1G150_SPHMI|nr:hypothetical protein [Sphingosinicella microcystinivorans]RKS91272.1 hypothetical protein DFR51_0831 [Sphingosinicella microcystinivorans]BBE34241.1 hypothetical protein SmB9_18990 [Sphingosinicella microcystinivorans]